MVNQLWQISFGRKQAHYSWHAMNSRCSMYEWSNVPCATLSLLQVQNTTLSQFCKLKS